jgi:16S rRNA (guanine527-N7)-methyltransferase
MSSTGSKSSHLLTDLLTDSLSAFGFPASEEQVGKVLKYVSLLAKWNLEFRFSAFKSSGCLVKNLVSPSIAHASLISGRGRLIDIGSGPGVPGLTIAVLHPDLEVTCLESSSAAVEFLRTCRESVGIPNLQILHGRAETLAHDPLHRERFGIAVARAFAPLPILLEIASAYIKKDGEIVLQCPSSIPHGSPASDDSLLELGLGFVRTDCPTLPVAAPTPITFCTFKKTSGSPDRYPRSWKSMKKSPLW